MAEPGPPFRDDDAPRVTVLLALYQGGRFVAEQLDSIARQTVPWHLIVADDGSTDGGPAQVRDFAARHPGRVQLTEGPRQGAAENFRALLARTSADTRFAALADQDDVWHPDKLARAVAGLAALPAGRPAIWCSRVAICDAQLRPLGLSRLPVRPPSFRHALVQNLVQGNTAVLNRAALDLVRQADLLTPRVVMHDWWLYQLVSGAGGQVIHDPQPSLAYRQHGANVVGANTGLASRLASVRRMLRGEHRGWSGVTLATLTPVRHLLTGGNRRLLDDFAALHQGRLPARIGAMRRGGFYRQGAASQAALWAAVLLGRI